MKKYAKVINDNGECLVFIGTDTEWAISQGYSELDVEKSDVDNNWYLTELCPMKSEEEKELEERERIAHLTCTKRVFALMLQELGITYTMLKQLIATNEQAQLEWDLCEKLHRDNPLLDIMAIQLGVTAEQLDGLFRYANGEITIEEFRALIPQTEEPVEEVVNENI